ncbi:hypothetical protein NDU88_001484 [Pleurodeles waltl]|uniref:Uncharacterized protein n=1 Tax=Pleurodeles waltl TaxID=8319 RepID=A0AAV7MLM7_PLEWA|nr:hypothetical protein NDU88_001484 [Pleurodeles waltl]
MCWNLSTAGAADGVHGGPGGAEGDQQGQERLWSSIEVQRPECRVRPDSTALMRQQQSPFCDATSSVGVRVVLVGSVVDCSWRLTRCSLPGGPEELVVSQRMPGDPFGSGYVLWGYYNVGPSSKSPGVGGQHPSEGPGKQETGLKAVEEPFVAAVKGTVVLVGSGAMEADSGAPWVWIRP